VQRFLRLAGVSELQSRLVVADVTPTRWTGPSAQRSNLTARSSSFHRGTSSCRPLGRCASVGRDDRVSLRVWVAVAVFKRTPRCPCLPPNCHKANKPSPQPLSQTGPCPPHHATSHPPNPQSPNRAGLTPCMLTISCAWPRTSAGTPSWWRATGRHASSHEPSGSATDGRLRPGAQVGWRVCDGRCQALHVGAGALPGPCERTPLASV
jgi:hypothetical protein